MLDDSADAAARLRQWFARMAVAAAALTFVVIVASALMRHVQAGLACADWPACYARFEVAGTDAPASGAVRIARVAHRLAATGVLALVIGMLLVAWTQKPAWKREGRLALVALAVAGALAALGIATPGARVPAITLGNLLGGYLMLALFAATVAATRPVPAGASDEASPRERGRALAAVLLALVFVQAASGGLIGAQYALNACAALQCPGAAAGPISSAGAFDPLRTLALEGGRVVPPADARSLHVVHRALGVVVALAALALAWRLRGADRATARRLALLAIAAPALGVAAILAVPALALTVLHNAATATLVAALAGLAPRSGPDRGHGRPGGA